MDYQRVWVEIDLDIIAHNTRKIRERIPCYSQLMAVVKADGYGHGALEVSKVCLYNGASQLGVAILDEGISLRENNIFEPILILGYTPSLRLNEVVRHDLMQTIFHKEMAYDLNEDAKKQNKTAKVHIKIDTGLSRLGFLPNEKSIDDIMEIAALDHIEITGLYTHFAQADTIDRYFTNEQYNRFIRMANALKARGLKNVLYHVANSGAVCQYDMFLDMSRVGIALYGLSPSGDVDISDMGLKPAMSFKTRVSNIKTVEKGISISYGRTYFTKRETVVATVPVGYADGYMQSLSNKGRVIVGGEYAPIIGKICMDQMMIDITDIKGVSSEDEVILMGSSGDKEITAKEIADIDNTIVHEVVCGVGKRVPRIYIKSGQVIKKVNNF